MSKSGLTLDLWMCYSSGEGVGFTKIKKIGCECITNNIQSVTIFVKYLQLNKVQCVKNVKKRVKNVLSLPLSQRIGSRQIVHRLDPVLRSVKTRSQAREPVE